MMMNAYSIYDSKVGQYGLPFFSHHHALALRIVVEAANDDNTNLSKYPNDYVLFCIGTYDDTNGVLQPNPPENLGVVGAIVHAALTDNIRRAQYQSAAQAAVSGGDQQ